MKRFWQILALFLLALTVPASMCCYTVDGCESEACTTCPSRAHHEDGEPHAPVACPSDTISHSQVPSPVMLPSFAMVELEDVVREMIRRQGESVAMQDATEFVMTTAPPEMRATWHFTHRTALPVRAPSIQA